MMYIIWKDKQTGEKREIKWHLGNPLPIVDIRTVTFQADGHELEMIIEAMRATKKN